MHYDALGQPDVHASALLAAGEPRGDLANGIWAAPPWLIATVGAVIALGAVLAVVLRRVYARRRRDDEDRVPRSRRRW